jgi:hypothetical protein
MILVEISHNFLTWCCHDKLPVAESRILFYFMDRFKFRKPQSPQAWYLLRDCSQELYYTSLDYLRIGTAMVGFIVQINVDDCFVSDSTLVSYSQN